MFLLYFIDTFLYNNISMGGVYMNIEKLFMDAVYDYYIKYKANDFDFYNFFCKTFTNKANAQKISQILYNYIFNHNKEYNCSKEQIICFLYSHFINLCYDNIVANKENKDIISSIREDKNKIIHILSNDIPHIKELIALYYLSFLKQEKMEKNRRLIYQYNEEDALLSLEKSAYNNINQSLKNIIINIYNNLIACGCDDITALSLTWEFFFHDFDPLKEFSTFMESMQIPYYNYQAIKQQILGLIYTDLYEDAENIPIINSSNYIDNLAIAFPLIMTHLNHIVIPKDEDSRNRILKHFILLQEEQEKRYQNRKKTYQDNRIPILKKVNSTYHLDELTFK